MMRDHQELKQRHPGMILLLRVDDCYEVFGEDAEVVSNVLGLPLTYRQDGENELAMTGFPHHALECYLNTLLRAKHRVVVADQVK